MSRRERHVPGIGGFTLIEVVVALAIMGILMLAMGSVILLASQAIPAAGSTMVGVTQASEVADRMASELRNAQRILQCTPTSIVFTVPDRDGDGVPERIGYSWSGQVGDGLTRTYNGHAATVLNSLGVFHMTYHTQSVTETYPGPGVQDTSSRLLVDNSNVQSPAGFGVTGTNWIGAYVCPQIPANAIGWRPTQVKVLAAQGDLSSSSTISLTSVGVDLTPASTLGQQTLSSLDLLPYVYSWKSFSFSGMPLLSPGQGVCVTVSANTWDNASDIEYDNAGGGDLLASGDGGSHWLDYGDKSLACQVYGKLVMPGPDEHVTRQYLKRVDIRLQREGANQPVVCAGAMLANRPELDARQWELDFTSDPTAVDDDADGQADWKTTDGSTFDTSTLDAGVWQAGSSAALQTQPADNFTKPTTIEARMEDTTVGGWGAMISCVVDVNGGQAGMLTCYLSKKSDGDQELSLYARDSSNDSQLLLDRIDLPAGMIDVRLLVNPADQTVAVRASGKDIGTVVYPLTSTSSGGYVAIGTSGDSGAQFASVSVREVRP